jgi:type VI secretion system protein ImpG
MEARLLRAYDRELKHLREMGGEFAEEFPKIAGRLGLDGFDCADPYVERLLEGFAFLSARVQLKLEAEFPIFTQHLLEIVYPHFLAPVPSMVVVQLAPGEVPEEGALVPRGSSLLGAPGTPGGTACRFRTGHDVTLWPLELIEAEYYAYGREVAALDLPAAEGARAAIRLRLRTRDGGSLDRLPLERLSLYLRGADGRGLNLYEQLMANALGAVVRPVSARGSRAHVIDRGHLRRLGFADEEALMPSGARSFQGYRLLREYFSFPERYLFVELGGLGPALAACSTSSVDVFVPLDRSDPALEQALDPSCFGLFCTPAVNLFPRRADRIHLSRGSSEYHVVVDRTRPSDFEVFDLTRVIGHGTLPESEREFLPLYAMPAGRSPEDGTAYYTKRREPRVPSARQRRLGHRTGYVESEMFLALVDSQGVPGETGLKQLSLETLCTNRDLTLLMPVGQGATDFTLESGAPVESVACLAGPTRPRPPAEAGATAWRLVSHLSLNHLPLYDSGADGGAASLRELLMLYCDPGETALRKQIEGVRSVAVSPCTRRVETEGPISFGRGLAVELELDEAAFEGAGAFLLASVVEAFLARYVTINSFTETTLRTPQRGELFRWPVQIGRKNCL